MAKKKIEDITPLVKTLKPSKPKVLKKDIVEVKIKLDEGTPMPAYAHDGDIGMDITATSVEYSKEIDAFIYHTGIRMESDRGVGCFLFARSSNRKTEAYLPNHVGVIDSFLYRGELCFTFKNRTDTDLYAAFLALIKIDNMPWWKKLFASYHDIWKQCIEDINNNPLQFAPYNVGDRIGQMVFFRHPEVKLIQTDNLSDTDRGEGGHGSTGH